jgi:hypothetical protein
MRISRKITEFSGHQTMKAIVADVEAALKPIADKYRAEKRRVESGEKSATASFTVEVDFPVGDNGAK